MTIASENHARQERERASRAASEAADRARAERVPAALERIAEALEVIAKAHLKAAYPPVTIDPTQICWSGEANMQRRHRQKEDSHDGDR